MKYSLLNINFVYSYCVKWISLNAFNHAAQNGAWYIPMSLETINFGDIANTQSFFLSYFVYS